MKVDYVDEEGFNRRVFIPDGMEYDDPSEGIPVNVDISPLYPDAPLSFVIRLSNALWNVGMIEPQDFARKDAPEKIRSALLSAVGKDTMDIIALVRERR